MTEDMDDNIWGDLDADEIPDDPNYVAPNTYLATVTEAKYVTDKETGERVALTWRWTIQEPDSKYDGYPVNEYKQLPRKSVMQAEGRDKPNAAELRQMAFLKQQLMRAFDFTEEEIKRVRPQDLLGKTAYITTKEGSSSDPSDLRKFVNVSWAISPEKYAEQQADRGNSLAI